ncbi:MAG: efflux RND transporter periplasmic adaptor subunit [Betaproteobacteria bacterium]|nr:efflux RND transporter periplasmic adaptor subunit [Betaproteobacteria bacterium]MBL0291468.1 efflux RND transporter periplasmic adaptor subunit [Betaproteobacteria bacterium]
MNKSILGGIAAVALIVAAGAGFWFGQQRATPAGAAAAPGTAAPAPGKSAGGPGAAGGAAVEAVKVATAQLSKTITAVGSLRSDESITVRPEVAGRVAFIGFQEGQRVPKGATLLRLDPAINQAEVQQAQANLTLAKAKYERAVELQGKGFISGQAKDEAENNLKVGEAALALANARLAKTEIKAPFTGVIGLRSVSVGDYVKEGADVVNLESIDALKVDFRVPEIYLQQVSVGQTLQVTLDALPGKTYEGKVFAINPLVDAAGRAIVIRAQVRNTDTALRPGMFARVRLFTRTPQEALVLPEQALVPQGEDQYVFRVVDGKAVRVKVGVGQRRDGMVEIVDGVVAGDLVVSAGQLKLRDGTPVSVAGGKPAAPGATAKSGAANGGAPAKAEAAAAPGKADAAATGAAPRS